MEAVEGPGKFQGQGRFVVVGGRQDMELKSIFEAVGVVAESPSGFSDMLNHHTWLENVKVFVGMAPRMVACPWRISLNGWRMTSPYWLPGSRQLANYLLRLAEI